MKSFPTFAFHQNVQRIELEEYINFHLSRKLTAKSLQNHFFASFQHFRIVYPQVYVAAKETAVTIGANVTRTDLLPLTCAIVKAG